MKKKDSPPAPDPWLVEISTYISTLVRGWLSQNDVSQAQSVLPNFLITKLSKPGWPLSKTSLARKELLQKQLTSLCVSLLYTQDAKTISVLALQIAKCVFQYSPSTNGKPELIHQKLERIIKYQSENARSSDDVIEKSIRSFLHQEKKTQKRTVAVDMHHPLKNVLGIPKNVSRLPREDIRSQLVRSSSDESPTSLTALLKQALPFAPQMLQAALGSELYRLARPVGFADKRHHVVLIEVDSASAAQEISYRKDEIISRLKCIQGFEHISDVRYTVKNY